MSESTGFSRLLSPLQIKNVKLRNRIMLPAFNTFAGGEDGYSAEPTKSFYETAAKGGVGVIVTESTCVDFRMSTQVDIVATGPSAPTSVGGHRSRRRGTTPRRPRRWTSWPLAH